MYTLDKLQGLGKPADPDDFSFNNDPIQRARDIFDQEAASIVLDISSNPPEGVDKTTHVTKTLGEYTKYAMSNLSQDLPEGIDKNAVEQDLHRRALSIRDEIMPEYSKSKMYSDIFEKSLSGEVGTMGKIMNYHPAVALMGGVPSEREAYVRLHSFASPMVRAIVEAVPGNYGETSKAFSEAVESYKKEKIKPISISNITNVLIPSAIRMAGEFALTNKVIGLAGLSPSTSSTLFKNHPYIFNAIQSANTMAGHNVLFNPEAYGSPSEFIASTGKSWGTGAALGFWSTFVGNKPLMNSIGLLQSILRRTLFLGGTKKSCTPKP